MQIDTVDGFIVVRPQGRIDSTTSDALEAAMQPPDQHARRMLLDLTNVPYMSSAGLRVVLLATKAAKSSGGRFAVLGQAPNIRTVFDISGLSRIGPLAATEAEAMTLAAVP